MNLSRFCAFACALTLPFAFAAQKEKKLPHAIRDAAQTHVIIGPDEVKWGPCPLSLPPASGLQCAVLDGDPSTTGAHYVVRAKWPDGYKIAPHWHPVDEHLTVISGTFMMGTGEKFDESNAKALPAGSFAMMPAKMRHYAWSKGETVMDLYGLGPFEVTYVNPADDPRKAPPAGLLHVPRRNVNNPAE